METNTNMLKEQKKLAVKVVARKYLADTYTPVSIYLKLRDHFGSAVLLESTDFRSKENCFSFIGVDPIASFLAEGNTVVRQFPNEDAQKEQIQNFGDIAQLFYDFIQSFEVEQANNYVGINGFFGHTGFDAVQYFDSLDFDPQKRKTQQPDINYSLYRYVIAINHFKDELYIIENICGDQEDSIDRIETMIKNQAFGTYNFKLKGEEQSNLTDDEFKALITAGKKHCHLGDVFQIVFSRQFSQEFSGDDFNVYRVLRSINPSPYLFYFDYGSYKIFVSSPEAQMVIQDFKASVNPIAGTYRRTGDDEQDRENAKALAVDPKENAEHIMLVDLARNDLGRHSKNVKVKELKEIQTL